MAEKGEKGRRADMHWAAMGKAWQIEDWDGVALTRSDPRANSRSPARLVSKICKKTRQGVHPMRTERRIYVCTASGYRNTDWWRDRDNACEVCGGKTEFYVPASELAEAQEARERAAEEAEKARAETAKTKRLLSGQMDDFNEAADRAEAAEKARDEAEHFKKLRIKDAVYWRSRAEKAEEKLAWIREWASGEAKAHKSHGEDAYYDDDRRRAFARAEAYESVVARLDHDEHRDGGKE